MFFDRFYAISYSAVILFALLVLGCRDLPLEEKTNTSQRVDLAIVNQLLPEIVPGKRDSLSTVYINDVMMLPDSTTVERFIRAGASTLLRKLNSGMNARPILVHFLQDHPNLSISRTIPMSPTEFRHSIGAIIFSRMAFSSDSSTAVFITDFAREKKKDTEQFAVVEVSRVQKQWRIDTMIVIPKEKSRLVYK